MPSTINSFLKFFTGINSPTKLLTSSIDFKREILLFNKVKTYLSKVFYFLGDLVSHLLYNNIASLVFYPIYRRLMLISISLDKKSIVWENVEKKESSRTDLVCKLKYENKFRNKG